MLAIIISISGLLVFGIPIAFLVSMHLRGNRRRDEGGHEGFGYPQAVRSPFIVTGPGVTMGLIGGEYYQPVPPLAPPPVTPSPAHTKPH